MHNKLYFSYALIRLRNKVYAWHNGCCCIDLFLRGKYLSHYLLNTRIKHDSITIKSVKNFAFCMFLGMYWQNFSCRSIWYPLQVSMTSCCHSVRWKSCATFLPGYSIFSLIGKLPIATQTPWKWFLRVPWWNTFQLGSRKAPKPLLAKKKFWAPKS